MKADRAKQRVEVTNADLVHVSRGTSGGEWFRRYWLAVGTSADLRDVPVRVKLLGEELVLFRDLNGRIGLVGLHCPHRGSSLEYGDIEERGIRCPYHGWLFDVSGQCLEQPAEPKGNLFHQKIRHLSYPVKELGGLIFAHLGRDSASPPPLPRYSPLIDRGGIRQIEPVRYYDYNWLNFYENSADPSHLWVLHRQSGYGAQSWGNQFFSSEDPPSYEAIETNYGMKMVMTKPGPTPDTEYVDTMSLALPSIIQVGDTEFIHARLDDATLMKEGSHCEHILFLTPNDDDHFMIFTIDYYTGRELNFFARLAEMRSQEAPKEKVKEYDKRPYMPYKGNVRLEDIVTQGTQGLLDQREEHLGVSDRGVIMLRRILREAIQTAVGGGRPKGVIEKREAERLIELDSFTGVRAKTPPHPSLSPVVGGEDKGEGAGGKHDPR